jgi:trans-AT polyketide synthase/acyltransferase/oxidoreductase domain-containing protein
LTPVLHQASLGWWRPDAARPTTDHGDMRDALADLHAPVVVVHTPDGFAVAPGGTAQLGGLEPAGDCYPIAAYLPPLPPESLGDPAFCKAHGLRYPYMTGAMANGIASAEIVEAMAHAGMLGSFGAAGLSLERVTAAIDRLHANLGDKPFAVNLIHSPNEPAHEMHLAARLIERGVRHVEASAYLDLTPAIVRYRVAGLSAGPDGVVIHNKVIAKISRTEVATRFLSPAPERMVRELVAAGHVTAEQAELATRVPMCDDITAEADSGGHTDNRPAITLLPTILALRNRLQKQFGYSDPVRVGLAGGIATPASVAAAFSMGAAYVCTGSVNQACVESGSSDPVRKMLAEAGQADVAMAPAADMFEMGVKLQVLKRGTMFAMRAQKLFELYRLFPSWEAIPEAERVQVEKTLLRRPFAEVWAETRAFFEKRDPTVLPKADAEPKVRMALVFRWYLGLSSRWANAGDATRQLDYQVWCGPAMGAFNEWAKGSHFEAPENRTVAGVALNLLYGAALHLRREALRQQGVTLPASVLRSEPVAPDELRARLG